MMDDYCIEAYRSDDPELYTKHLSKNEYDTALKQYKLLDKSINEMRYCKMLNAAYGMFINEKAMELYILGKNEGFVYLNLFVANWLNAFYMWEQYHVKNYGNSFITIEKKYKEQSDEYSLICALRGCMTHRTCIVSGQQIDLKSGRHSIIVDKKILGEDRNTPKEVVPAIRRYKNMDEEIDLVELSKRAQVSIRKCQYEFFATQSERLLDSAKFLMNMWRDLGSGYSDLTLVDDTAHERYSISYIIYLFIHDLTEIYPEYSERIKSL